MNIVVYCRVSSKEQIEGTSLDSQQTACRDFAARKGWTIASTFIEEGESAKFADRTKLLELLAFCKDRRNQVEGMLVWKIDRFARNIEDHYMIKANLRRLGVRVVSVTEPVDSDPNGKLMEAILAGFAQFDNDIRAVRSVQGMKQKLQEGIWPWNPPLGYLAPKLGKKKTPDRPDPERFELLQKAWQFLAAGTYTKAAILRLLRQWDVRPSSGEILSAQTIGRLFSNPYYAGILRNPWTGEQHIGQHVPMVTVEQFARVQEVMSGRSRTPAFHRRINEDFPVRSLVRCSECRRPLTAGWSKGRARRYAYYSCHNRACEHHKRSLPAEQVHREFRDFLPTLVFAREMSTSLVAALIAAQTDQEAVRGAMLARQRDHIGKQERRLSELVKMRTSRLVSDSEFVLQRDQLRTRIQWLQANGPGDADMPLLQHEASGIVDALADLPTIWGALPASERDRFGHFLFPAGYVYRQIRTAETGLLFKTFEASGGPPSHLVARMKQNPNRLNAEIRRFLGIVGGVLRGEKQAA